MMIVRRMFYNNRMFGSLRFFEFLVDEICINNNYHTAENILSLHLVRGAPPPSASLLTNQMLSHLKEYGRDLDHDQVNRTI